MAIPIKTSNHYPPNLVASLGNEIFEQNLRGELVRILRTEEDPFACKRTCLSRSVALFRNLDADSRKGEGRFAQDVAIE